jgi:type VI secretion system protein ImpI
MDIMFEVVSRQKHSASFPTTRVFGEAGGYIGRADDCEWILPDRSKRISRKHALISFDDGDFYIEDLSSNGVFLSLGHEAIGKGGRHKIAHGEGFVIGEYTIMARLLHNPQAYSSPGATAYDIHSFAQPLSLHPLTAMDQEEEMIARHRLGEYDELLGRPKPQAVLPADHTDPRLGSLLPVVAVQEQVETIPEDWDDEPEEEGSPMNEARIQRPLSESRQQPAAAPRDQLGPASSAPRDQPVSAPRNHPAPEVESVRVPETDVFFKTLGFAESPATQEERTRILELAAQLLVTAVTGMTYALQHRNACKNELRLPVTSTGFGISNNPLKFSPTPEAALSTLLGAPQKGVLSPVEAMSEGFDNLHSHHMGLLAGARAAVRASLEKIGPQAVETRLDANGPVRLNRTARLWHTFIRLHHSLRDDHNGLAALFLQDFARAYEVQRRTLHPTKHQGMQEEHSL